MDLWISWWQAFSLLLMMYVLLNGALNAWFRPVLRRFRPRYYGPKVSLLVPARNEARTIADCVRALMAQTYRPLEVLVLDDQSTDATPLILARLQEEFPSLRVIRGEPLPVDWLGKNWACHQLAQRATGEILIFVDADTLLHPDAVAHTVAALEETGADMLSGLPYQVMLSWPERLSLPFLRFGTHGFLPTWLLHVRPIAGFTVAVGQYLVFRRAAYVALGGHAAVRDEVVEDVALARRAVRMDLRVRFMDPRPLVRTRMYNAWPEIREGFLKNLWPVFGRGALVYLFLWAAVWSAFVLPWLALAYIGLTDASLPGFLPKKAWETVALSLLNWRLYGCEDRKRWDTVLFHPVIVTTFTYLALLSLYRHKRGLAVMWKEREIRI